MFARLFLLFSIVPFVELFLLLTIGREIGVLPTVAMIILPAVIGAALAKREGLRVYAQWQRAITEMRVPEEGITSGLLVLVGGALLIAPGVLTDIVGILLMIAPFRRVVARVIEARVRRHVEAARATPSGDREPSGPFGAQQVFRFRVARGPSVAFDARARQHPLRGERVGPRPLSVVETDGVVIEEWRPDTDPKAPERPVDIEAEIVE